MTRIEQSALMADIFAISLVNDLDTSSNFATSLINKARVHQPEENGFATTLRGSSPIFRCSPVTT